MSKGLSDIAVAYLLFYNFACFVGWFGVLLICFKHVMFQSIDHMWTEVHLVLKIVQTSACLEVFHSMVGLVKSPWQTTLMQVFSRVWTVWAIMNVATDAQTSIFTALACMSWSFVEIPRYLFYTLNLVDGVPYLLFWLRYSLFAVLYPTGITGEVGCMFLAGYSILKSANMSIESLSASQLILFISIVLVALSYVPGSPTMYGHMVKTRQKQFKEYKASLEAKKSNKTK